MTDHIDSNVLHDHSYYGNGCSNGWGEGGYGGSDKSCSTRFTKTYDNETQIIGTYYSFQAATSGSGGAITTLNANAPDTFCPLGWQMPYSGTGGDYYDKSRSWKVLTEEYEYGDTASGAAGLKSYPIDYVYSGNYFWNRGRLYALNNNGYYWSSTLWSDSSAANLSTWADRVSIAASNHKALGINVRCTLGISNLRSLPWHPRSLISIMAFHFLKVHFPSVKIMSNYLKHKRSISFFRNCELILTRRKASTKWKTEY